MSKFVFYCILFLIFVVASCNLGFTQFDTYYYLRQQKDELDDVVVIPPTEDIELSFGIMFDVLEPNGTVNKEELEAYLESNKEILTSNPDMLQHFYNQLQELPVIKKEQDASFS